VPLLKTTDPVGVFEPLLATAAVNVNGWP